MNNKPNIITILLDDMGFSDIGCFGGEIETPNIDRLAQNGISMTQFYSTARCCPTRASLMTGLHPHQTGIGHMTTPPIGKTHDMGVYGYRGFLNRDCVTIAEVLKEQGYHTYLSGKWHLGYHEPDKWPLQRGFERFYGIVSGGCSYFKPKAPNGLSLGNNLIEPEGDNYYTTDAFTDYAIKFISEQQDDKPYFLYLAYNAPHWPLQAKAEDVDKYVDRYLCGWDEVRAARYKRLVEKGIINEEWKLSPRDSEVRPWDELAEEKKKEMAYRMAVYAAQIHCADYNIGRLLNYLEEKGQLDSTLITFMSDNGGCAEGGELGKGEESDINNPDIKSIFVSYGMGWANVSNTPFKLYKHYVHEGGISGPFIAHWPAMIKDQKGSLNHSPAYLIDYMPTILEIASAEYPTEFFENTIPPLDGKSMLPIFKTGDRENHEYMYWEHENNCSIRFGHWKALQKFDTGEWELYDIKRDRTELNDLARENPDVVSHLSEKWHEWAKSHHVVPKEI